MEHEHTSTPERKVELPTNVFDLEKLTPDQVAGLIVALGAMHDAVNADTGHKRSPAEDISVILGSDMTSFAERSPDKANELYITLVGTGNVWTKSAALYDLAGPLVRKYADDLEKRQTVIDRWLELLHDNDSFVRESAVEALSRAVCEDWLDEPTMRYLDSQLPPGWRRDDL